MNQRLSTLLIRNYLYCMVLFLWFKMPVSSGFFRVYTEFKIMYTQTVVTNNVRLEIVNENVCNLCKKPVKRLNIFRNGYFGLLDGCNHAFCLNCIRTFRRNFQIHRTPVAAKRNCLLFEPDPAPCPVCQSPFRYIMASTRLIKKPGEKAALLRDFKENTKHIPCNFMKRGFGANVCDSSCSNASFNQLCFVKTKKKKSKCNVTI